MQELTPSQIRDYARKWMNGTITPEEKELFEQWYNQPPPEAVEWKGDENEFSLKHRLFKEINAKLKTEAAVINLNTRKRIVRNIAVAVIFISLFTSGIYFWLHSTKPQPIAKSFASNPAKPEVYTRYVMLSDGSTVILHAGSTLTCEQAFNKSTREVTLIGEAYFDIKHDAKKPFIIHTGNIKTTVVGTAFNIKACSDAKEIVVSVTRGKVRVEDEHKVLAILTANKQVVYNVNSLSTQEKKINAMAVITDWTKEDMDFNSESFQSIANELSKRYNVVIQFKNESLKQCPIKAYFNGTESLNEVLDVVCAVRNATYVINNNKDIIIDGEGCN